jgi:hypothetical protein
MFTFSENISIFPIMVRMDDKLIFPLIQVYNQPKVSVLKGTYRIINAITFRDVKWNKRIAFEERYMLESKELPKSVALLAALPQIKNKQKACRINNF